MVSPRRRTRAILASCVVVASLVLGLEAWVVSRHDDAAEASLRARVAGPDRDARPLPRLTPSSAESHVDSWLSRVASRLGRRRAEVRCWSPADWSTLLRELDAGGDVTAYTTIDERRVHAPSSTCRALHLTGRAPANVGRAAALASLAHELEHLRGVDDEARAECYSYQHLAAVAEALGAMQAEAQQLSRLAWRHLYPPSDPDYFSPDCRNGGELDLRPHRARWP
jgi:hypothetical protein